MKIPFEGGCACGAIRYRCDSEPVRSFKCHCVDCQQATGSGFVAAILVRKKHFHFVKGTPVRYALPSTRGGTNTRSFCGVCGSRLTGGEREHPAAFIGVTASSLDNPADYKPEMHFFVSQKQRWDIISDDLPQFDQYPPTPPAEPNSSAS